MKKIELILDIDDDVIAQAGVESLKAYVKKSVDLYQLHLMAIQLRASVGDEPTMDADFQIAKQLAWEEYQNNYLPEPFKAIINARPRL